MAQTFTRQELYDLVWSVPISTLAAKHGLSDRGLAKICERHQIPVPGRGHWTRIEAGQTVVQTPLWKLDNPAIQNVTLWSAQVHPETAFKREATRRAKAQQGAVASSLGPGRPSAKVEIRPMPLRRPEHGLHSSLARFSSDLRKAPVDREGGLEVLSTRIHRDMIPRVLTFLNTLAFELEPDGIVFAYGRHWPEFHQGQSSIHFALTSPKKRIVTKASWGETFTNVFAGRLTL